ncbi:GNAT family N-acetyltransferase [Vibrio kagoshimensis]|uniref:GNAT family N-acetyltransferase n=1 Tax=Vibrio kagoshimensis TaxID=2910244 RepID=UPI003D208627
MITWQCIPFSQLTTQQLYELLRLRTDVFVVEQTCPYPELDGKDTVNGVHHLLGYKDAKLVACARLLPQGVTFDNVSIGRVTTRLSARGDGLGHQLLTQALLQTERLFPSQTIDIGAQEHLEKYYEQHGFKRISEMYLEDDIPHIDMRLEKK